MAAAFPLVLEAEVPVYVTEVNLGNVLFSEGRSFVIGNLPRGPQNPLGCVYVGLISVAAASAAAVNWRQFIMYKLRLSLRCGADVGKHTHTLMDVHTEGQN